MIPSERLKWLHNLAERTRQREREIQPPLKEVIEAGKRITDRLMELRRRELREWMMTDDELAEHRRRERETELDRADERNGDWTR